jgi:hypothetical protein
MKKSKLAKLTNYVEGEIFIEQDFCDYCRLSSKSELMKFHVSVSIGPIKLKKSPILIQFVFVAGSFFMIRKVTITQILQI